jgi:hypothetical protein
MLHSTTARARAKPPLGVILYEGPSLLDGAPIVVVATGFRRRTANSKTGDMVQTWILRSDVNPVEAIHTGQDASICGDCPFRGVVEQTEQGAVNRRRSCYVAVHQAPLAVYRAYRAGRYVSFCRAEHLALFADRFLRLGSYGEPVAAPLRVWSPLLRVASGSTGYTHQWRNGRYWRLRRFLMASVESLDDARRAWQCGWRTFRCAPTGTLPARGEFRCPASAEQQHRLTCERCAACNGAQNTPGRASAMIWAHGSPATLASYRRLTESR